MSEPTPPYTPHPGETLTDYRLGQIEQSSKAILRAMESLLKDHQVLSVRVDALEVWKRLADKASERTAEVGWQMKLAIASAIASPLGALAVAWVFNRQATP
jgi:hypothetical protein